MKRFALLTTVFTAVLTLVLPFVGGSGPSLLAENTSAHAGISATPIFATPVSATADSGASASAAAHIEAFTKGAPKAIAKTEASIEAAASAPVVTTVDTEHLAQKPVPKPVKKAPPAGAAGGAGGGGGGGHYYYAGGGTPAAGGGGHAGGGGGGGGCPANIGGHVNGNADLQAFAVTYNAIRVAHCLQPVPMSHFRYDTCMQTRLQWMANDPHPNPGNTWGHSGVRSIQPDPKTGQYYSVTHPSQGCDGNLAGGYGNTGATVAQKWWNSLSHRASLYRPSFTGSTARVCINFAMTHGGNGDPYAFTRAAARWIGC